MMDSSIKKNQGRCPVIISLFSFADALLGETLAMDVRILAEEATVEDFLTALDQFAAAQLADCRGCDGCCHERAPLIAADIPRLAGLLAPSAAPAHMVCSNLALLTVNADGAADITMRRQADGACSSLQRTEKFCCIWQARPFVCRSHFCTPRSPRFSDLRESIVNRGENELTRLLLAEEAAGAAPLPEGALAARLNPADYAISPISGKLSYASLKIRDCVDDDLWQRLRAENDPCA